MWSGMATFCPKATCVGRSVEAEWEEESLVTLALEDSLESAIAFQVLALTTYSTVKYSPSIPGTWLP